MTISETSYVNGLVVKDCWSAALSAGLALAGVDHGCCQLKSNKEGDGGGANNPEAIIATAKTAEILGLTGKDQFGAWSHPIQEMSFWELVGL